MSDTHARPPKGRWLGLIGLTLGVSLIIVDGTILNVAVPSIVEDLGLTVSGAQWANTLYALILASLLVTSGRIADRTGRRRAFAIGIVVFLIGSLLAGLAWSPAALLGARVVQGIGGAVILPTTLSLVNASFRGKDRATAFAVYGSVIGGVVALGPLMGGWFITSLSWRWAFFVNVPFAIVAIVLVHRFIAESRDEHVTGGFDVFGTLLFALGVAALVFVTIDGRTYGWWSPSDTPFTLAGWQWPTDAAVSVIPVVGALGLMLLAVFAWHERRRARRSQQLLVEFPLFRIPTFAAGNVTAAVVSLGEFGLIFLLPLWFQVARGFTALETGAALLALAGGAFVASGFVIVLTPRIGQRGVVMLGMALEIVGILWIAIVLSPDGSIWVIEAALFVYGIGVGFATAQLTSLILDEVPVEQSGAASGISSTSRQLGSALGIAIIGSVFAIAVSSSVESRLVDGGVPAPAASQIAQSVEQSAGERPDLPAGSSGRIDPQVISSATVNGVTDGARKAGFVAAGFVLLGLLSALRLPRNSHRNDDAASTAV